jgi:hypothetical protein
LNAPFAERFDLRCPNLIVHLGIAIHLTKMLALQEFAARFL